MPSSAATSVAALPLLSHSSTAWHLKALSNFFRVCLDWITGLLIRVYLLLVFFVPVSARSAQPQTMKTKRDAGKPETGKADPPSVTAPIVRIDTAEGGPRRVES